MAENGTAKIVVTENMVSMESKKSIIEDRLYKREEERQADAQKRRDEKSNITSVQENAKFFTENFATEKNNLEIELQACESLDKNKLVDKFDSISVQHLKLQRFLTESTMFLPSYDVRQAQETLTKLQAKIQEKRDELIPKKKFAFRSKKKGSVPIEKAPEAKDEQKDVEDVVLADCKLTDKKDQNLEMSADINMKDVALARLENCTVKLFGAPSAIHINKLNNCKIFSGPVSGSIFIRECSNCIFVVPCQQLRIHTTKDTKFYIHVTSRAIIEDSSTVSFGPYNWKYPAIEDHYNISGLDRKRNSWDDIDDFNWLAADKHSPNWSLVSEEERSPTWD